RRLDSDHWTDLGYGGDDRAVSLNGCRIRRIVLKRCSITAGPARFRLVCARASEVALGSHSPVVAMASRVISAELAGRRNRSLSLLRSGECGRDREGTGFDGQTI